MAEDSITVVIPTFNRFHYLCEAIDSALTQTRPARVVVVDHGSTDETPSVEQIYSGQISYHRRDVDSGPHFAWLDGCLLAQSEFVKLLYDDDVLEPTYLERGLELFRPSVGFVFSAASFIDDIGRHKGNFLTDLLPGSGIYSSSREGRQIEHRLISPSAAIFRREDLIDSLFMDKHPLQTVSHFGVGPDHLVKFVSMLRYRDFGYLTDPLVRFRSHAGSITVSAKASASRNDLRASYAEIEAIGRLYRIIRSTRLVSLFVRLSSLRSMLRIRPVPSLLGGFVATANSFVRRLFFRNRGIRT